MSMIVPNCPKCGYLRASDPHICFIPSTAVAAAEKRGYLRGLAEAEEIANAEEVNENRPILCMHMLAWENACRNIAAKIEKRRKAAE